MTDIGSILGGKYRVVAKIGEGGMGSVYHAENVVTGKQVALKQMHGYVANNPHYVERFIREARAAASLDHPNVLDIYDIVQDDAAPFLIMELLQGETLRAYLRRNPFLEVPAFLALLLPAMDGVAAAHECGVVHRDLKPDNIFLVRGTRGAGPIPKVVDFGIARLETLADRPLTQTGATLGTPEYMSLEQLRGASEVDARTDVYAFGVMLYDALAGRLPHVATTLPELIIKVATTDAARLCELRPDLPPVLTSAVDRSLARDRADRWPDLRSLLEVLAPFAHEAAYDAGRVPRIGKAGAAASARPATPAYVSQARAAAASRREGVARDDTLGARELSTARATAARQVRVGLFALGLLAAVVASLGLGIRALFSSDEQTGQASNGETVLGNNVQFDPRSVLIDGVTKLSAQSSMIRSGMCLVDADGDAYLDLVGSTGYASKGPAAILDGRTGEQRWSGGAYELGASLFCPSPAVFVMNDQGSFTVTIRSARSPDRARDVRLSDVPDRWGFGPDCMAIRTKDGQRYDLSLPEGKSTDCDAKLDGVYQSPQSALQSRGSEPTHLTRGDERYLVELRKPGTPVLTVRAEGRSQWTVQLDYQSPSTTAVLAGDVLAVVGRPLEESEPRLHVVGLDVATGRIRYEQPLCQRGLDVMSMRVSGSNIVLTEPWTGVFALDAKTGRIVWRSGSC